jgi:UDP-glucose 4-epimerase
MKTLQDVDAALDGVWIWIRQHASDTPIEAQARQPIEDWKRMYVTEKRCLVTGGAGFIGSALVRQIADQCSEVVVVDNLANGRRENLDGLSGEPVQIIVADIRDDQVMTKVMRGVEIVFHLACLGVRHSIHSPEENHEVNATATLKLLSAARAVGVKRFVYVSSSEVYGTARWAPMTEEHPTYPNTVYGASKLAGECYARAFYETYGYPTVVVRPFNAYGPRCHHEGDSGEVIPKFLLRCMAGRPMVIFGDGTQTRDFTYVSDTARGILLAGLADEGVGQTINLGSGREIAINDLAREVATVLGKPDAAVIHDDPRPGDVLRLRADITKARSSLGFEPMVTLGEGLARLRDWYLSLGRPPEMLLEQEIVRNWEPVGGVLSV